jgi:N-acetylglucosaminyl-diphospho-decaprenol L-rhamnosyltransferase
MPYPAVDIIIVNWNAGKQLRDCLDSIAAARRDGYELARVVVVDNASSDHSANGLRMSEIPLIVVSNRENRGFAAACNQGIRDSSADYVLLLNPDTRVFEDSLSKCIEFLSRPENSGIGIVGPQLLDARGYVARSCARFPSLQTFVAKIFGLDRVSPVRFPDHFLIEWDHANNRDVDQVIGAFFLVRRKLFNAVGTLDERFFVFFEELDFTLRAFQAGWRTHYLAEARAFHKGGGTSERVKARRLYYSLQSRILYGFKHFGWLRGSVLLLVTAFIEPISRLGLACARFSVAEMVETLHAYALFFAALPGTLKTSVSGVETSSALHCESIG